MMRRGMLALVLLAAALHAVGIARTQLPAQDGLKFIRVARDFQQRPAIDVIRASDQHPLYPALIALAEPVVSLAIGHGPEAWRIAAQGVAALASLALLIPLFGLTRDLFTRRIALLAVLIFILLPFPAAVGHDTLSDSLGLCASLTSLWLGSIALRGRTGWKAPIGCGLIAGLGYMARPEVLISPLAVALAWLVQQGHAAIPAHQKWGRLAGLSLAILVMIGGYALAKGEVSEKLALRHALGINAQAHPPKKHTKLLPTGLNTGHWDFSPKEESEEPEVSSIREVIARLGLQWAECLGGGFAILAIWGMVRARHIQSVCQVERETENLEEHTSTTTGRLIAVYLALFSLVLARHASRMGYLSDRHTLTLVLATLPWAAAGTFICARGIAVKLGWAPSTTRRASIAGLLGLIVLGVGLQAKPSHPSRWGHWAAGRWIADHAKEGEAVLDTRGWAAFVSRQPSYDYWHVRQALSDSSLRYVVVGTGELQSQSPRANTLRTWLAYSSTLEVAFPERKDRPGQGEGIRIYRYERPESWEDIGQWQ